MLKNVRVNTFSLLLFSFLLIFFLLRCRDFVTLVEFKKKPASQPGNPTGCAY